MEENQLKALVESVVNYFNVTRNDDVSVGTPYLLNADQAEDAEFLSGMIAISGNKNGWLRYSAPRIMIKHLLLSMGESDTSIVNMEDMVGEVANTISGNLRKHFGSEFSEVLEAFSKHVRKVILMSAAILTQVVGTFFSLLRTFL